MNKQIFCMKIILQIIFQNLAFDAHFKTLDAQGGIKLTFLTLRAALAFLM